jgi:SAM-dependent methyltransferase
MVLEKNSEWILPENLKKQEQQERKQVEDGTFDGGGDFGSYYAYRKGVNLDFIKHHAVSDDEFALCYARNLRSFLKTENLKLEGKILDVGCAIGAVTNAINKLNRNGQTYGLDISEDAIEVARKKYPGCLFYNQSADNLDNFSDTFFDIIHAREFYPFTRTDDSTYQLKYLKLFCSKLKAGGFIVLQMVPRSKGFWNTYEQTSNQLKDIGYSTVKRSIYVPAKVYKVFGSISYNRFISRLLHTSITRMIMRLMARKVTYFYILVKSRN